jgi:hypothetical protein
MPAYSFDGDLYLSPEAHYKHNVFNGQDSQGRWDETTHAYWAKDEPGKAGYDQARALAIDHTVKEIERLYAAANGNLQAIFKMNMSQLKNNNVLYTIPDNSP